MATYVTSLRSDAKLAHIGYPVTACGIIFTGTHRVSDNMPTDRRICRECITRATSYGLVTNDEATALLNYHPAQREVIARIVALLIDGSNDREVARRLGVSMRTISRHVAAAMSAAGAQTRFQWGFKLGRARA
ncbi:MAG: hypothetical protein QOD07_1079 [Frankiaceae bacterium]|jgi:hypothetical protein|nr:hypothetical protein [Frankiaceae bacterium]